MSVTWNYNGVFPNDAEHHGCFWGQRGIRSFAGNPYPVGILSGLTNVTTPCSNVITCIAVNTFAYSWQNSSDGNTWADIPDEYGNTLSSTYTLGQHGIYWYRCICRGLLGETATAAIKITVREPAISVYLTSDKSSIVIGECANISAFIIPYPAYAKSFTWQQSSDGEVWTDMPEVTSHSYSFVGTEAGTVQFRMIGTQYDSITVTSNELPIEVTEPEP